MTLLEQIYKAKLPQHIAIIMDGNGRWAKSKGKQRVFGHKEGAKSVREIVTAAGELGIKYLTLYAFSTENWNRPKAEVDALMSLLVSAINSETKDLMKNNVRLLAIGNHDILPKNVKNKLYQAIEKTSKNTGLTLTLALSYSAKWEMVEAVKNIAHKVENKEIAVSDINEELIDNSLATRGLPHPELMIRTSGEYRISNFLLWQLAYSELYFTDCLWPEFRRENLYRALLDYQSRERRFGKTSEQVK